MILHAAQVNAMIIMPSVYFRKHTATYIHDTPINSLSDSLQREDLAYNIHVYITFTYPLFTCGSAPFLSLPLSFSVNHICYVTCTHTRRI